MRVPVSMSKFPFPLLAAIVAASPVLAAPTAPEVVGTQGMQFVVPDGWRLERFRPDKAAILQHEATGAKMLVSRPAKARAGPAPKHIERTGNGRVVQWDYGGESLNGRLSVGVVEVWLTVMNPDLSRVPTTVGIPAMRRVADTLAVTGPLLAPAAPAATSDPKAPRRPSS
ncbi:MAG: hypothetical protein ABW360_05875 [Phenylobacterium sp.]